MFSSHMVGNHKITLLDLNLLCYSMQLLTEEPCHVQQVHVDYLTYAGMDDEQILKARPIIFYFNYVNRSINESGVTNKGDIIGYYKDD